jgi:hypothetical protein
MVARLERSHGGLSCRVTFRLQDAAIGGGSAGSAAAVGAAGAV